MPDRIEPRELNGNLDKEYKAYRNPSLFTKTINNTPTILIDSTTSDTSIFNSLTKLVKNSLQYLATLVPEIPSFGNGVKHCGGISDTFKFLTTFKGMKNLKENISKKNQKGLKLHVRNLNIASATFSLFIGPAAFVKLLDVFGALKIAEITSLMGASSVVGHGLAIAFPFTVVTNLLDIGKSTVEIALASIRIHENRMKKAKTLQKAKDFNANNPTEIRTFMREHVRDMRSKQAQNLTNIDAAKTAVDDTKDAMIEKENRYTASATILEMKKEAVQNSAAVIRFFGTLAPRWNRRQTRFKLFQAKKIHDKACGAHNQLFEKWKKRGEKILTWNKFKTDFENKQYVLSNDVNDPLCKLITDKQSKWKVLTKDINIENLREGVGILINTAVIVTLVAATVLFFLGLSTTLPGVLSITSAFLLITLLGLGNELFKKVYNNTKPEIPEIDVTKYAQNAVA